MRNNNGDGRTTQGSFAMGDHRSKEDEVMKLSSSIFVTNFPDKFTANELWTVCNQYGNVVDAFIPDRRSKSGKRSPLTKHNSQFSYNKGDKNVSKKFHKAMKENGYSKSYVHAVKIGPHSINKKEGLPAIVLDETCFNQTVYSTALMGKVKDFTSLTNLKVALANEGFDNIKLKYMGGFWVMIEFNTEVSKERFRSNVGIGSWFAQLLQASNLFFIDERVTWVDIEGIPLKGWSKNTFSRITSKWGELLYFDEQEEGYLHSKRVCIKTKLVENIYESFKIIIQGKIFWVRAKEVSGWIPDFEEEDDDDDSKSDNEMSKDGIINENGGMYKFPNVEGKSDLKEVAETIFEKEQSSANVKEDCIGVQKDTRSEDPFNIYELLNKKKDNNNGDLNSDDNLKYPPRFTTTTDVDVQDNTLDELDVEGDNHVHNIQDDKVESAEKKNSPFNSSKNDTDRSYSPSVGTSGGILCIWDPSMFRKINSMISDYFVMIQGEWVPNGTDAFNRFISTAGLEEVPLDGCKFTWCHKSASKMSKLERFLIYESLMNSCPNISAITLDRYLSDHGPILMRESHFDYSRTPFRFFHYWFELAGFDNFVEQTWNDAQVTDTNDMSKLMKKLKYLKEKIRRWIKDNKDSSKNYKQGLKDDLVKIDLMLDNEEANSNILTKRIDVLKSLQDLEKLDSMETAQKTKIKWAIEGDENSKYYHGVLNKKRNQLAIRGILAEGRWIESPVLVKKEKESNDDFKVDFEKAYDSVRWDYLDDILKKFGFGDKWCGWIRNFLISSKGSVIVNNSPTKEFQFHRGLKQSDHLFPFLFILIMESHHILVQRVVDASMFRDIKLGPSLQVSHLFYADDTVFIGHWSDSNIDTILCMSDCFYHASGLHINMTKSKLMGISISSDKVDHATKKIGCAVLKVRFSYLGSKVSCLMSRTQSWNEIVNNILARLSKWKMKTISIGGRLTLLKSILGLLLIYHMSLFKVPSKVLQKMESIICHFFNGVEHNGKKQIWVKWSKVLASKEKGGLGVSSIYALNRALF
ncbi:RNA-directed DNA polymerase, eukaryota, reverse transcriptase zinc-binding domain protein [Tanacetum coccineum]